MKTTPSFLTVPEFAYLGIKTSPPSQRLLDGYIPPSVLPSAEFNWLFNNTCHGINSVQDYTSNVNDELVGVLTSESITPDDSYTQLALAMSLKCGLAYKVVTEESSLEDRTVSPSSCTVAKGYFPTVVLPETVEDNTYAEIVAADKTYVSLESSGVRLFIKGRSSKITSLPVLTLAEGMKVSLLYTLNSDEYVSPMVKIDNPSSLPAGNGLSCCFSPSNDDILCAISASPYYAMYSLKDDVFSSISLGSALTGACNKSYIFRGDRLVMFLDADVGGGRIMFKKNKKTGLYDLQSNYAGVGTGATSLAISHSEKFFAVGYSSASPYIAGFYNHPLFSDNYLESDAFWGLVISTASSRVPQAIAFHPSDESFVIATLTGSYSIRKYVNTGTDSLPAFYSSEYASPALNFSALSYHPSGEFFVAGYSSTPFLSGYYHIDIARTPFSIPAASGTPLSIAFSPNGRYMAIAIAASPYVEVYEIDGTTFTKLANPATLPTGAATGCSFSRDGKYLAVTHANSPYLTVYKFTSSAIKEWTVIKSTKSYARLEVNMR